MNDKANKASNKADDDDQTDLYYKEMVDLKDLTIKEGEKAIDELKADKSVLNLQPEKFKRILNKMDKDIKTLREVKNIGWEVRRENWIW